MVTCHPLMIYGEKFKIHHFTFQFGKDVLENGMLLEAIVVDKLHYE